MTAAALRIERGWGSQRSGLNGAMDRICEAHAQPACSESVATLPERAGRAGQHHVTKPWPEPFRRISKFVDGRSVLVWIEDCVTLEARPRAECELEATAMRGREYP